MMLTEQCAALIMAGGQSSRMRRGGSPIHKALRTVAGRPLLEWNIAALTAAKFRELYVAISQSETELEGWVAGAGVALAQAEGAQCSVLEEPMPLGTAGALGLLPDRVRHVLVVNADNLTDLSLSALVAHHVDSGAAATLATHVETFPMPFGQLELRHGAVTAYREKPLLPLQISSGTSVFSREAIDCVPRGRTTHIPQLVGQLLASGMRVAAFEHRSRWIDVNDEQALAAAEAMLLANEDPWPGGRRVGEVHA